MTEKIKNYGNNAIIEEIRSKANIVEYISNFVQLQKKGKNYWCLCPFHQDTKASLSISTQKQIFRCFVCGAGGNIFSFAQKYLNLNFIESVKIVGEFCNIDTSSISVKKNYIVLNEEQIKIKEINEEAYNFFAFCLSVYCNQKDSEIQNYINSRGLGKDIIKSFKIGYCPPRNNKDLDILKHLESKGYSKDNLLKSGLFSINDSNELFSIFNNRLIFSIFDQENNILGFSGRTMLKDVQPKYINSPETNLFKKSEILYGIDTAIKANNRSYLIIVEGFMDKIALYKLGITNCIATMGTSFSAHQIDKIKKICNNIILCLDSDNAGIKANIKIATLLFTNGFNVRVVKKLPEEFKDIDELVKVKDKEFVKNYLEDNVNFVEYKYNSSMLLNVKDDPYFVSNLIKEISNNILEIKDEIVRAFYFETLSKASGISIDVILKNANIKDSPNKSNSKNMEMYKKTYDNVDVMLNKYLKSQENIIINMLVKPESIKEFVKRENVSPLPDEVMDLISETLSYSYIHEGISFDNLVSYCIDKLSQEESDYSQRAVDKLLELEQKSQEEFQIEKYINDNTFKNMNDNIKKSLEFYEEKKINDYKRILDNTNDIEEAKKIMKKLDDLKKTRNSDKN